MTIVVGTGTLLSGRSRAGQKRPSVIWSSSKHRREHVARPEDQNDYSDVFTRTFTALARTYPSTRFTFG